MSDMPPKIYARNSGGTRSWRTIEQQENLPHRWNVEYTRTDLVERMERHCKEFIYGESNPEEYQSELDKLQASNEFLKNELKQLANFNPDWDMLEATRASLRDKFKIIKDLQKALKEIERIAVYHPPDTAILKVLADAIPTIHNKGKTI